MSTDGYFSMFPILVVNKLGWTFICVFNRDTTIQKYTTIFKYSVGIQVQKSGTHHRQQQQQYILNIFVQ